VVQRLGNGYVRHTYRYCAFGVELNPAANNTNRFRWGGMYWDAHTQTYYTQFRHYNPRTGRWLSEDPHWGNHNRIFGDSPTMMNDRYVPSVHAILQAGNLFMFTMHNPVFWADSSGLFATPANIIGGLIGAGLGAIVGTAIANHFELTGWRRRVVIGGTSLMAGVVGWFAGPAVVNVARSALVYAVSTGMILTYQIPKWVREAINWASQFSIPQKIIDQMSRRGWTPDSIRQTINTATQIGEATNRATGNSATVFFVANNYYVVVDNVTRVVIQISNKLDSGWIPDPSFIFR